jgi:hypothetical protein
MEKQAWHTREAGAPMARFARFARFARWCRAGKLFTLIAAWLTAGGLAQAQDWGFSNYAGAVRS